MPENQQEWDPNPWKTSPRCRLNCTLESRLLIVDNCLDKKRRLTNMLCSTKEQRIKAFINEG